MSAPEDTENPIGSGVIESDASCRRFSLAEIQSATNNFKDAFVIGVGGFGNVYKGFIIDDDGTTVVAIKRLNSESKQGAKEFSAEIKTLSNLRHTNLVALIGYCSDYEEKILVYEYIARGTLADHLYKTSKKDSTASSSPLSWEERLEICVGAARGLNYIHSGTNQSFIHRDVKTANILLDENWVVKISDFGLSKGTTSHSITHLTTDVKGTFGYLDPDYFLTQRLTTKSDVYAFGVVLLEVLCGRQPVDKTLEEEQISLVSWAQQCIKKRKLNGVIDPSLSGQISSRCLNYYVKVVDSCLQKGPKARPTMAEVVESLEVALALQRKVRTEGIFTKAFQGIPLVPKAMDHWLRERKDDGSVSGPTKDLPQKSHPDSVTRFFRHLSFADIRAATIDFNKALLIRGYLNLYKGYVNMDGRQVLVAIHRQVVTSQEWDNVRAAIQESSLLHHRHLVPLRGFCYEGNELILVYDYVANVSLQDRLNRRNKEITTWKEKLEICIGAARGLQYLHMGVKPNDIHYDIKPSNIWLDEKRVAKVIGLKITSTESKMTQQSDVYSFGVVLWEVLRSKMALDGLLSVIPAYRGLRPFDLLEKILQIKAIEYVLDPYLIGKTAPESLEEFGKIALSCLSDREEIQRPSMDYVVESLQSALQLHEIWLSSTKIDPHDLDRFSRRDIFWKIGELVCTHAPHYEWVEGPRGLIFVSI